jgi:hypothetical protein
MNALRSTFIVISSLYVITGGTYKLTKTYQAYCLERKSPKFYLCKIVQTGLQKEALKTAYLGELMEISADKPTLFDDFDPIAAQKKLVASLVIEDAFVRRIAPDTVYVDYTVRLPIAYCADFENIVFDSSGACFPLLPFFAPKTLPEVFFGIQEFTWKETLPKEKTLLALQLLQIFETSFVDVKKIDVSRVFKRNLAKKEIIAVVNERGVTKILRLSTKNFEKEIQNYLELRKNLVDAAQVIDLRIPDLGFIQEF